MHLLLLVIVLHQLVGSQFIEMPRAGQPPETLYTLHEYAGIAGLVCVVAFWVWTLVRRGETRLARLVPWFSLSGLRDVAADVMMQLRRVAQGRVPSDEDGAAASAVHGLGLLVLTAMAMTGTVFFVAEGTPFAHTALGLHRLMANLMWAYLVAHAGLAILHRLTGSDIFTRMFWPHAGRAR